MSDYDNIRSWIRTPTHPYIKPTCTSVNLQINDIQYVWTTQSQSAAVCRTMTRSRVVLVLSSSAATLTSQPAASNNNAKLSVVVKHGTQETISRRGVPGTYGWRRTIHRCNWNCPTHNKPVRIDIIVTTSATALSWKHLMRQYTSKSNVGRHKKPEKKHPLLHQLWP